MDVPAVDLTIRPALHSSGPPVWDGAVWVGEVWVDAVDSVDRIGRSRGLPGRCRLEEARGYSRARLLVRSDARPLGFVEVGVTDGRVEFTELMRRVAELRVASCPCSPVPAGAVGARRAGDQQTPAVTVVVCTRDRVSMLRTAIESILAVEYPDFEMIVVDNAAKTDASRKYVLGLKEPRVRVIDEPRPGASRARNAGLLAATGDIVAFADDDVVVDRHWLRALINGFALGTSVSCVSGMVAAGEIRTPAQAYFDRRVHWSDSTQARVFDWTQPPRDVPLFPFAVRHFGTGASFAVDRDVVIRLGGFDEALGPGTPTGGGEDLDMFFRILRAGRQLVHDPAAVVWHRHRPDNEALVAQTRGYRLGLGAWLGKIARDREVALLAARTAARHGPTFIRHLRAASNGSQPPANLATLLPPDVRSAMWAAIINGLWAYRSARREGRSPEPLLAANRRLPDESSTNRIGAS